MYSSRSALTFSTVLLICASVSAKVTWEPFYRGGKVIDQTAWFSEEEQYARNYLSPVSGMQCFGSYCDMKRLFTVRDGANPPILPNWWYWTEWFSDNPPFPNRADCPPSWVVLEVECRGSYCDEMRLFCGELISGYRVVSTDKKVLPWVSEEQGRSDCPDGYYVSGMACHGHYCDDIQLTCVRIDYAVATTPWKLLVRDGNTLVHSKIFNEQDGGFSGRMKGPIAGINCIGDLCGRKQLMAVERFPGSSIVENTGHWTNWFDDTSPTSARCPDDMVVNEIQCKGKYCEKMRLQCGKVRLGYVIKTGYKEAHVPSYYDKGMNFCPNGYYVVRISCAGSHCANISLDCVAIEYA